MLNTYFVFLKGCICQELKRQIDICFRCTEGKFKRKMPKCVDFKGEQDFFILKQNFYTSKVTIQSIGFAYSRIIFHFPSIFHRHGRDPLSIGGVRVIGVGRNHSFKK